LSCCSWRASDATSVRLSTPAFPSSLPSTTCHHCQGSMWFQLLCTHAAPIIRSPERANGQQLYCYCITTPPGSLPRLPCGRLRPCG
jgi:hypothetical protein